MEKWLKRSLEPSTSGSIKNKKKNRLHRKKYLKYGFTVISNKPQCVVCQEVLARTSMKPSKLLRHLNSKHPDKKDKPVEFFKRKLSCLHKEQAFILSFLEGGRKSRKHKKHKKRRQTNCATTN